MSAEVQTAVKVDSGIDKTVKRQSSVRRMHFAPGGKLETPKRLKGNNDQRNNRKRAQTGFAGRQIFVPYKKRKKEDVVRPTKFLLGGNIRDPLNLNSLQDEEVNRAVNAFTPESSPLPTPQHRKGEIEVIIPPDIRDPLNLAGEEDNDAYAASFRTSSIKKVRKKNKKKKPKSSTGSGKEDNADIKSDESKSDEVIEQDLKRSETPVEPQTEVTSSDKELPPPTVPSEPPTVSTPIEVPEKPKLALNTSKGSDKETDKTKRKVFDNKDRIVSPVVPQPGAWQDRHPTHRFRKPSQVPALNTPKFKEQNKKFQYGNYHRYYGYRNPSQDCDPRLKLLARTDLQLFLGKDVLDIGCNAGNVTVSVARDFGARKVVGVDIDRTLIETARANLKKYCSGSERYPVSMPIVFGSLDVPGLPSSNLFPHNLSFVQGNYVLENDVLVNLEQPQFDVILCFSITKWLHLNWGDAGLKRVFKRIYAQLRPGGKLILEPQSFNSYRNKKNLTETTWKNYQGIKFFPNMFTEYLLSEVGFASCELVGAPFHPSRGFQRPIKIFTKNRSPESDAKETPAEPQS